MHHADGISPERDGEPMAGDGDKGAAVCVSVKAETAVITLVGKNKFANA